MKSVCICKSCGRTIEKNFIFCPWCGVSQTMEENVENTLSPVFEKLEEIQNKNRMLRMHKIGDSLDELEKDLSLMVLQAELAR